MSYVYIEVQCPCCDHIFMWNKTGGGLKLSGYKLRTTGETLEEAKCPKCGLEVLVLDHILEGIDVDDDRVEKTGDKFVKYHYEFIHCRPSFWTLEYHQI